MLRDFGKPALAANIIARRIAFMASSFYLNTFVQRAALTPGPFVTRLTLSILVALIAVASQIFFAAATQLALVLGCD